MSAKPARAKKTRASRQPSARHGEDVAIPDKLYFRIGEVARLCRVPAYVLRFWETEFPQLKPNKSSTGQRMYRRNEVEHALRIKHLLYREGFTIPGARQQLLAERRKRAQGELPFASSPPPESVKRLRQGLRDILAIVSSKQK